MPELKTCTKCGVSKPVGEYRRRGKGYRADCKACHDRVDKGKYGLNRRIRAGYAEAKRLGRPCDRFTDEDLMNYWLANGIDPSRCFYTGIELNTQELYKPESLELEHVIPLSDERSSHTVENIVPACHGFNQYKSTRRAVEAVLNAPEHLRPVLRWEGPTDKWGNPLVPPVVEWVVPGE